MPEDRKPLAQELSGLIAEVVEPDSWIDAGGEIGSLSINGRLLTVRQTPENLRLLEVLLQQLAIESESERLRRRIQEADAR